MFNGRLRHAANFMLKPQSSSCTKFAGEPNLRTIFNDPHNDGAAYLATADPLRAPGNYKRRVLRRAGYYSEPMKMFRFIRRIFK